MYFVTLVQDGKELPGVFTADQQHIIPLTGSGSWPVTMIDLIARGDSALAQVRSLLDRVERSKDCENWIAVDQVKLKAPIPHPAKNIFCIGKNYREHALEFDKTGDPNLAVPKHPVIFTKPPTTVIGPGDNIDSHSTVTQALDYEVELAVVIGKAGKFISKQNAMDHVFGYTIFNDVTARDLQQQHIQWFRGKSLDTFGPMGPYLVHKSAIPHPDNLSICSRVNGELRQNANTGDLIFDIPTLISTISAGITLEPGDIIATGTPAGVGYGFKPPKFLQPGDELELSISGLGVLKNKVV